MKLIMIFNFIDFSTYFSRYISLIVITLLIAWLLKTRSKKKPLVKTHSKNP